MKILVVNAGSSTFKLSLFDFSNGEPLQPIWKGILDWGRATTYPQLSAQNIQGMKFEDTFSVFNRDEALSKLVHTLWEGATAVIKTADEIQAIGHRVVHGGIQFTEPVLIDNGVITAIQDLIPLAPLHNPGNLEGIQLMKKLFPTLPQVAVFDTAFHRTIPDAIQTYPIPYEWKNKGILKYGFHGISHHYCADRIVNLEGTKAKKIVNCHLGNGASICAIQDGKSYNTTMGLTPLEGLMMGTRSGSVDPGLLLYFLREISMPISDLDTMLNFKSGLKGICGTSDMRDVMEREDDAAKLAYSMYIDRLKTYIGAMAASMGGIDVLNFTAGIGENANQVRKDVCESLKFMGIRLDLSKNQDLKGERLLSCEESSVKIYVIPTQEEWMIARISYHFS